MNKLTYAVLLVFLFVAAPASAQVSCSAKIDSSRCKEASDYFEVMSQLFPKRIPIELVTGDEFKVRVQQIRSEEGENFMTYLHNKCGDSPSPNREYCKQFVATHFMNLGGYERELVQNYSSGLLFLRDSVSSTHPDRILLSFDSIRSIVGTHPEKQGDKTVVVAEYSKDGSIGVEEVHGLVLFVIGYLQGNYWHVTVVNEMNR